MNTIVKIEMNGLNADTSDVVYGAWHGDNIIDGEADGTLSTAIRDAEQFLAVNPDVPTDDVYVLAYSAAAAF